MLREGVKLVFEQDIYRLPDMALAARGTVDTVIVENGKLTRGEYFDKLINKVK
jgi:acyl-CoA thioester hydrolase